MSNPTQDIHNINAQTKFEENPLTFTQVIVTKQKYGRMDLRQTDGRADEQTDGHTTANVKP